MNFEMQILEGIHCDYFNNQKSFSDPYIKHLGIMEFYSIYETNNTSNIIVDDIKLTNLPTNIRNEFESIVNRYLQK